jgi:hypothetical protein
MPTLQVQQVSAYSLTLQKTLMFFTLRTCTCFENFFFQGLGFSSELSKRLVSPFLCQFHQMLLGSGFKIKLN